MKKTNDILFMCQYFYPEYISSATLPFDTAKALVNSDIITSVLCGFPYEYIKSDNIVLNECHEGIHISRVKYIQMNKKQFFGRIINYFSFTTAMLFRLKHIKFSKVIIVYSNPPILPIIAVLAKKMYNTKIIFVSYDVYPEIAVKTDAIKEGGIIDKFMNFINNSLYKNVDQVVALSYEMKNYLLENRKNISQDQINVIPNWYNKSDLRTKDQAYSNKLFSEIKLESKLVISYFGNLGTAQDMDTIINAIRELKYDNDVVFLFAGHGNKFPLLKRIVKNEKLNNVFLFDFLHGNDFEDAINISDIFLVSIKKGLDGLAVPSKTYTYLSAGKPIISIMDNSSDIAKDLIAYDAGYNIQPDDVTGLLRSIDNLKKDVNLRRKMGANAKNAYDDKYTTEKCTEQYVKLINEVLEDC